MSHNSVSSIDVSDKRAAFNASTSRLLHDERLDFCASVLPESSIILVMITESLLSVAGGSKAVIQSPWPWLAAPGV